MILNPQARRLAAAGAVERLRQRVGPRARLWSPASLSELDAVAQELCASGAQRIALCGGDGTYMRAISALCRAAGSLPLPALALLPGGTVATAAKRTGTRGTLNATLERFLRLPAAARHRRQPTLRVSAAGQPVWHGFTAGTGLVARFFERYYRGRRRGAVAAAGIAGRVFASSLVGGSLARELLHPLPLTLHVEDRPQAGVAYSLVVASVFSDVGLGFRVTYRAAQARDRIHLVAATMSAHRLGRQAPRVLLGLPLRGPGAVDRLVRRATLQFASEHGGPLVLDGDLLFASSFVIEPGVELSLLDLGEGRAPTSAAAVDGLDDR